MSRKPLDTDEDERGIEREPFVMTAKSGIQVKTGGTLATDLTVDEVHELIETCQHAVRIDVYNADPRHPESTTSPATIMLDAIICVLELDKPGDEMIPTGRSGILVPKPQNVVKLHG